MKVIASFLVLFLFIGCNRGSGLSEDPQLTSSLSTSELEAFETILRFGDMQMGFDEESSISSWTEWISTHVIDSTNSIVIDWNMRTQDSLFDAIPISHFADSIWYEGWAYNGHTGDSSRTLFFNPKSSFGRLYATAAEQSDAWKEIWNTIRSDGEFPPSLHAGLFSVNNPLFQDPKMRLLITLRLMQINFNWGEGV